jgi:hypothetical protein
MNKQSPEYIRVREEIAKKLTLDGMKLPRGETWESWCKDFPATTDHNYQIADSLLEIKGIGIIADNQDKPINHWGNDYGIAQHDMEVVGFKRLVE